MNRRDFLKKSALLGGGLGLSGFAFSSSAEEAFATAITEVRTVRGKVRLRNLRIKPNVRFRFDPNVSTTVSVSGNVVVEGILEMRPARPGVVHKLRIVKVNEARFVGGPTMEPLRTDPGVWVVGAGKLDLAGTAKLPWARASAGIPAGATTITLDADPLGWRVGDVVVITPTLPPTDSAFWKAFDRRRVVGIAGRTITLNQPTQYAHPAVEVAPGRVIGAEVLNLSRNVRIQGTRKGRSHIMIMGKKPQSLRYVSIRWMGPRKASSDGSTNGVLGRYPLHFHGRGDLSRGSVVKGVVAQNSGNHAFVPHSSHGIAFRECIAYNIIEDAYWWDPPDPTNDTLFSRCVAADVRLVHPRETRTAGFNLGMGKENAAVGCVAVGIRPKSQASGFKWRRSGLWRFEDCVAHNNSPNGIFAWTNDDPKVHRITRFLGYHNGTGIMHGAYGNSYLYEDSILYGNRSSAISIKAVAHAPGLRFERILCDGASISDYLVRTVEHKLRAGRPTEIIACTFRGARKAAIGWVAIDPDTKELFNVIDCLFDGNEFWLDSQIHPDSYIRVQDALHGTISLQRADKSGDFWPEWNASVNAIQAF